MSAVPKKKLCWNCEGNVPKDLDNCPYCAVYLHGLDEDNNSGWTSSRYSEEEIPEPLYQKEEDGSSEKESLQEAPPLSLSISFYQLKRDVFPALFLMAGSVFFLFGIILFLFAYDGVLTLQWQGHYAPYFLIASAPLIYFGWNYLQRLED